VTQPNNEKSGIFVPARFIPTPRTVSPQAQAFLSRRGPVEETSTPDPKDKAAWRAYVEERSRGHTAFMAHLAQGYAAETITHQISAAPLYEVIPRSLSARNENRAILYIHGGAFVSGGGQAALYAAMPLAGLAQTRTYSIDYRMPPDHPFPAGLNDTVAAYCWLLERYKPEHIALYGISAGGNLALACLLKARDMGMPMAAGCALHSPATDLTESGDTYETNDTIDVVLKHRSSDLFALYADGQNLRDPLLSPLFGDYSKGFPPTVLTSGTRDLLLSSTVLMHRALRRAGIKAELHVWEAMTHAPFFGAPEEQEVYKEQIHFLLASLDGVPGRLARGS
jgi:monoterpene epsilon-lactone hydrolase